MGSRLGVTATARTSAAARRLFRRPGPRRARAARACALALGHPQRRASRLRRAVHRVGFAEKSGGGVQCGYTWACVRVINKERILGTRRPAPTRAGADSPFPLSPFPYLVALGHASSKGCDGGPRIKRLARRAYPRISRARASRPAHRPTPARARPPRTTGTPPSPPPPLRRRRKRRKGKSFVAAPWCQPTHAQGTPYLVLPAGPHPPPVTSAAWSCSGTPVRGCVRGAQRLPPGVRPAARLPCHDGGVERGGFPASRWPLPRRTAIHV